MSNANIGLRLGLVIIIELLIMLHPVVLITISLAIPVAI